MDSRSDPDAMMVIAILVSRVEALAMASMLEAAGIHVRIDGVHHASVEVNSIALGGHRLWVPAVQHEEASAIVREVGLPDSWQFCPGLRRAIWRFLGLYLGTITLFAAPAIVSGLLPLSSVLGIPLAGLTVPVSPQGRGDYYLAPAKS